MVAYGSMVSLRVKIVQASDDRATSRDSPDYGMVSEPRGSLALMTDIVRTCRHGCNIKIET